MKDDPHRGSEEVRFGPLLEEAESAVVLIHGRGDSSRGILTLAPELQAPRTAFVAPQAVGFSWYPFSFLSEVESNEPWLSSALDRVEAAVASVATVIGESRVVLLGFSQGACLVLEFAARNTRRYGGLVAFSGGLIGPDGTPRDYPGSGPWRVRRSSWAAATSTRTFRWAASMNPRRFWRISAARSRSGSIRVWGIRSTETKSLGSAGCSPPSALRNLDTAQSQTDLRALFHKKS